MKQENPEKKSSQNHTLKPLQGHYICDETTRQSRQKRVLGMYREIFSQEEPASAKTVENWGKSLSFLNSLFMKKTSFAMATTAVLLVAIIFALNLVNKGPASPLETLVAKVQAASQKAPARYHFQKLKNTRDTEGMRTEGLVEAWIDNETPDCMIVQKDSHLNKILGIDLYKNYINFSYDFKGELLMARKLAAEFSCRQNTLFNFNEELAPILRDLIHNKDSEALNSFLRSMLFGNPAISQDEAQKGDNVTVTTEYIDGHVTVENVENKAQKKEETTISSKYLGISTLNGKKVEGLMTEIWHIVDGRHYSDDTKKPAPQKVVMEFYFDAETFELVMVKATSDFEIQTIEFLDSSYSDETPSIQMGDKSIGLGPLSEEEKTAPLVDDLGPLMTNSEQSTPNGETINFDPDFWESIKTEDERNNGESGYFLSGNEIRLYSKNEFTLVPNADIYTFIVSRQNPSYAKDKTFVYFQGKKIERANSISFQLIDDKYSSDKDNIFYNGVAIEGARTDNFSVHDSEYLVNGIAVFYHDKIVEGADPQTFRYLGQGTAIDKNGEFEFGVRKK